MLQGYAIRVWCPRGKGNQMFGLHSEIGASSSFNSSFVIAVLLDVDLDDDGARSERSGASNGFLGHLRGLAWRLPAS